MQSEIDEFLVYKVANSVEENNSIVEVLVATLHTTGVINLMDLDHRQAAVCILLIGMDERRNKNCSPVLDDE